MESWATGVRQGCILTTDFLNLYSEKALSKIKASAGLQLGERNYNNLWYADDTALFADTEEKIHGLINASSLKHKAKSQTYSLQGKGGGGFSLCVDRST